MNIKNKSLISIPLLSATIILFHYIGWLTPIESFIYRIFNPISSAVFNIKKNSYYYDDITAYQKLKNDYQKEKIDEAELNYLREENIDLQQRLNFLTTNNYHSCGAEVIGKNIDPLGSTILINRGLADGVKIGNSAIVGPGVLVGVVSEAQANSAVVRLINDNKSKIAATINNQNKSIGLIEGDFAITVRMNFIPQNEEIKPNDSVITSGLNKGIPRGLLIGSVEAVEKEAYQPFQRAIITPAANLDKIYTVSILIP